MNEPRFALAAGRLALDEMLNGYGYDITGAEVYDAFAYMATAAGQLGIEDATRAEVTKAAPAAESKQPFVAAALLRAARVAGSPRLRAVRVPASRHPARRFSRR